MGKLIIHAPSIHQGGGRTLLLELLASLPIGLKVELNVDKRMELPEALPATVNLLRVPPTLRHRLNAERRLFQSSRSGDNVLCFGNLPPLWRLSGRVWLFAHNAYLVSPVDTSQFPWRQRLRIAIERRWLRSRIGNVDDFIVQTESMRLALASLAPDPAKIRVLPFVPAELLDVSPMGGQARTCIDKPYDFCYVSTGEPHKNHRTLILAWRLLANRGLFPSLCITLSPARHPQLCDLVEQLKSDHGLKIDNLGMVPWERIAEVYHRSRCLVFPSLHESFGLPLVEARRHGLKVVAPELDYVRDLIEPDETFDAHSPRSLARAIERVLGRENERERLLDGSGFLQALLTARAA